MQYRKQVADGQQVNAWTTYTYTDDEDNRHGQRIGAIDA